MKLWLLFGSYLERVEITQTANNGPQDVPKTSPFNVPRTSPKHPIWTSFERPSEDLLRMLWGRLLDVPKFHFSILSKLNPILRGVFRTQSSIYPIQIKYKFTYFKYTYIHIYI